MPLRSRKLRKFTDPIHRNQQAPKMPKRERETIQHRGHQPYHRSRKPVNSLKRTKLEDEEYRILDKSIPEEARRIQQRQRAILKGKNTVGYDEYVRQVPKSKRRPRNPEHPMTPDHTRDIPNRRWLGLVKAWYVPYVPWAFPQNVLNACLTHHFRLNP